MAKGRKKPLPILGVKMICPASGLRYTDQVTGKFREIGTHYMVARMCRTDRAIFLVCQLHEIRAFLSSPLLVSDIKRSEGLNAASSA